MIRVKLTSPHPENGESARIHSKRFLLVATLLALLGTGTLLLLLASVPPVSRDALTHHLYIPKLFLEHGRIYEIPSIPFAYYPMNLELLYLVPLAMGNDIVPKYIHLFFALATAYMIWRHVNARLNDWYAILAALFFLTIPIIVKLSITVYVDLGLIFFSTGSLLLLIRWMERGFQTRYLVFSGICCGLALGTKYNALIILFLLTLFATFIHSRYSPDRKSFQSIMKGVIYFGIALSIFSPWMVKNFIWTGNPIYPLFKQVFSAGDVAAGTGGLNHFLIRHLNYDESWLEMALIPIRIFFQGEDGDPKYFDGRLNPILFIFPLLSMFQNRKEPTLNREKKILLFFSAAYILFAFFQIDMRIRYITPAVPPLVILSLYGIHGVIQRIREIEPTTVRKSSFFFFGIVLLLLFWRNISYLKEQVRYVDPLPYLTGEVGRDEYIRRYRYEYPTIQFANENLPENSVILALFLGNRGYYSDRDMLFSEGIFLKCFEENPSAARVTRCLEEKGITHLLIRGDLFNKWINDNIKPEEYERLSDFVRHHVKLLHSEQGYMLVSLENVSERPVAGENT